MPRQLPDVPAGPSRPHRPAALIQRPPPPIPHPNPDDSQYKYFNTNNLWLNLGELKSAMDAAKDGVLPLPVIKNGKTVDPQKVCGCIGVCPAAPPQRAGVRSVA